MPETYLPSDVQTGLPVDSPLKIQTDTDTRLNNMLTMKDVPDPVTDFSSLFNTSEKVQKGIPQSMSFSDAYFSKDPKIKSIADSIMQSEKDKDPFTKLNLGVDVRTPIAQADKFIDNTLGFDYRRDNEDYYAQYKNAGLSGKLGEVGKFVGRTVGSAVLKLGEGIAGLLAMATAPFQEGNYWTNVADNALVQGLSNAEEGLKNKLLPVYQSADARGMGVFHRMFADNTFWTSDVSDGLAFMLSAIAPGVGLSKVGFAASAERAILGEIGEAGVAKGEALAKGFLSRSGQARELANFGKFGKITAGGVDKLLTTTLNTVSEAFFEAKGVHDSVMQKYSDFSKSDPDELVTLPDGSQKRAADLTMSEKQDIASTGARNDFFANIPILMFSNAFETKLLYKALGKAEPAIGKVRGLNIAEDLSAKVNAPTGKLATLLNGRAGFYAKKGVEGIFWEGLWEENAQLAAQRLNDDSVKYDHDSKDFLGLLHFGNQILTQSRNAARDASDPLYDKEAATSIGLGALIGVGGGVAVSALTGEYSKQKRSDKVLEEAAVASINNARNNWLSEDIFARDAEGKPVFKNGKPVIDEVKLLAKASKINTIAEKAKAIEGINNPEIREQETKKAFADYVNTIALAGKQDQLISRLNELGNNSPEQLAQLGFDANQQIGNPSEYAKFAGELFDVHKKVQKMDMGALPKGIDPVQFQAINMDRKNKIYSNLAHSEIYNHTASKAYDEMESLKTTVKNADNISVTDNFVDEYNLLKARKNFNLDTILYLQENPRYVKILEEMNKDLDKQIAVYESDDFYTKNDYFKTLKRDNNGYLIHENKQLNQAINGVIGTSFKSYVTNLNQAESHKREAAKLADPKTGFNYFTPTLKAVSEEAKQDYNKNQAKKEPVTSTESVVEDPLENTNQGVPLSRKEGAKVVEDNGKFNVVNKDGEVKSTHDTEEAAKQEVVESNKQDFKVQAEEARADKGPPVQSEEDTLKENNKVQSEIEEEENSYEKQRKINNVFSLSSKAVKFDAVLKQQVSDDLGRPEFNPNQDNIIDSGKIIPGTKLNLQFDKENSIAPTFTDGSMKSPEKQYDEKNNETAAIKVTYKDPTGREHTVGYLHTIEGARGLLTEKTNVEEQLAQLKVVRDLIVSNPDTVYEVEVTRTGFGFLNKGDARGYKTISEATDNDNNVKIAIKKGDGFVTEKGEVLLLKFGKKIKDGSLVILLPNNVNGQYSIVPVYIAKKPIGTDPKMSDEIGKALEKYLASKDPKDLNEIRNWVYITNKPLTGQYLTNNGLYLNEEGELIYRGENIRLKTTNELLSKLLPNINESALKNPNYIFKIKNSPAFQTTVFAQKNGDGKSYFHQHTIVFSNPVPSSTPVETKKQQALAKLGDILEEPKTQQVENKGTKTKEEILHELENGYLEEGDGELEDQDFSNDITASAIDRITLEPSDLVIPGFTSTLQQTAIKSISYLALTNKGDKEETLISLLSDNIISNKDSVKSKIQKKYDFSKASNDKVRAAADLLAEEDKDFILNNPKYKQSVRVENNLKLVLDNYDALFTKATEDLDKIGLQPEDEDGFYNDIVELDESMMVHDDDSEMQKNHFDKLSKEVRKFISFTPEMIDKDEFTIVPKLNAFGFRSIADPKQVYNMIINSTSEDYNEPTPAGFEKMLEKLSNHPSPTVIAMAESLMKSNNWILKFQFFTNMSKFKTNHIQQLLSVNDSGVDAQNIEANRTQITRVIIEDMHKHFLENSPVVDRVKDENGNTEYSVDWKKVLPFAKEFKDIVKDNANFYQRVEDRKVTYGTKKEALIKMHNILKDIGFDFDLNTFRNLITNKSAKNPEGIPQVGLAQYFTGGNRILDRMTDPNLKKEDTDPRNPFNGNPNEMTSIAKLETSKRLVTVSDSFRSNGKNYYPFTRMSYVKGILQQVQGLYDNRNELKSIEDRIDEYPTLADNFADPFKSKARVFSNLFKNETHSAPEMWFMRGFKDRRGKDENTEIKNSNEKEFLISKIHSFQNGGAAKAYFYSDTYSDKVTRFAIKDERFKVDVGFTLSGKIFLDKPTLDLFYNYVEGEADRIENVKRVNKEVPEYFRIPDFHDIGNQEGIGKYFTVFPFLNQSNIKDVNVAKAIYDSEGNLIRNAETKPLIQSLINDYLVKSIERYQKRLESIGFFEDSKGDYSAKGLNDSKYYRNISSRDGFDTLSETQKASVLTADYLLNHSLHSIDMLAVTGDPALSPKVKRFDGGKLKINDSVRATLVEASKRNASLNAPFDQGISLYPTYKVLMVNDIKINSEHIAEYTKLLGNKAKAYGDTDEAGDKTDAQGFTTVFKHLRDLLKEGRISPQELAMAFAKYDIEDFKKRKADLQNKFDLFGIKYNLDDAIKDKDKVEITLTPFKPVQRGSKPDRNIGQVVEIYIKNSSFPLVPELVKGTDFEKYLNQMQDAGVDALEFKSGIKQGIVNPQNLNPEGSIIGEEESNILELNEATWGEQVYNPEKEKNIVTEGSQQQRLITVDMHDDDEIKLGDKTVTGAKIKEDYIAHHKVILDSKIDKFFEELEITKGENPSFESLKKLSKIIETEGVDRGYDDNTIKSLKLNEQGHFYIPLTFLPNSSQIQSLIAAVISNRILKNKLPGKSFIQGSEVILQTSGKVSVTDDLTKAKNSIIWTKPEYRNKTKLDFLTEGKPAQVILPFFWRGKDNKLLKSSEFVKDGFLDISKIDPEMLEINGFRIPYAGLNSGMWFEVAGFLPEYMGDLVIVPAEIAAQMGSDYDVDKLFTYVKNHTADANGIRVDNSTPRKQAENDIIDIHKAIYMHPANIARVLDPTSTDEIEEATKAFEEIAGVSDELYSIFDTIHQDNVWLSNRAGQVAVAISANYNTIHSIAQSTNLFVKGVSVKFKEDNKIYGDKDFDNATTTVNRDTYKYQGKEDFLYPTDWEGTNRLDRVHLLTDPTVTISSVIGNWLQASVDNAKLQILGRAGLNKFNFNIALTIILHGFDSKWAINFVNQPILKEFYQNSADLNDRFNKNFESNKKEKAIAELLFKYQTKAGIEDKDVLPVYAAVSMNELKAGIYKQSIDKMTPDEARVQFEVLRQYVNLDKISRGISDISSASKVEVSGLSQSFAEIAETADKVLKMQLSTIGNTENLYTKTVSGLYLTIPEMVTDLFTTNENPIFAYATPVYESIKDELKSIRSRELNAQQTDDLFKELKQFIYTHPQFNLYENLQGVKVDILGTSPESNSLVNLLRELKIKYPSSVLLNQLSYELKKIDNDPDILTLNKSDQDISLQMKQDWLDFFKSNDPQLVTFANKLSTYSLLFANKEFGPSTLLKVIPFEVLKGIGFGEGLNAITKTLGEPEGFKNFIRQYIQHNPEFAAFVMSGNIPKATTVKVGDIISEFVMPEATEEFVFANPQLSGIFGLSGYKKYVRTYINEKIGQTLYELQSDNVTFKRIDTLGNANISEYDFGNPDVKSAFPAQQSPVKSDQAVKSILPSPKEEVSHDYTAKFNKITSASDALAQIQNDNSSADSTPVEQMYYELAKVLEPSVNATMEVSQEDEGINGSYYPSENKIYLYPNSIKGQKGSQKLNFQSTLLHESIHSVTDSYIFAQEQLPQSQQSQAFKTFKNVWNTYRKNFIIEQGKETVRGIQDSFLKAELFKELAKRTSENARGAKNSVDFKSVLNNWDKIKNNKEELLSVIYNMQESMKEAYRDHQISKKADFDLVKKEGNSFQPIDIERVKQVLNFLGSDFSKEGSQNLKSKYYAYSQIKEFSTMTLTDTGFQEHLNTIPGVQGKKSLWNNFKDFVKKVVSSFQNNSLLDNAIDAVLDLTAPETVESAQEVVNQEVTKTPVENTDRTISDRLMLGRLKIVYPKNILKEGYSFSSEKLQELVGFQQVWEDADMLPSSYFLQSGKLLKDFGIAANQVSDIFELEMGKEEAEWYKQNDKFVQELIDAYSISDEETTDLPGYAKILLEENKSIIDTAQGNLFDEPSNDLTNKTVQEKLNSCLGGI